MIIKINRKLFISVVVGLFVIAGIAITIILNPSNKAPSSDSDTANTIVPNANVSDSTAVNSTSSRQQTATMGAVTVDIEPKILDVEAEKIIFSVAFNTHSVELDFDFTEIIALRDDLGNEYKAQEWTGNSGWHHVSGDIIFPKLDSNARKVTVLISEIEGDTVNFNWDVEN